MSSMTKPTGALISLSSSSRKVFSSMSSEEIILALLTSPTLEMAARQCRLSVRQLYERRQDPAFVAKLKQTQAEALESTTRFLQSATGTAARVLAEIAESPGRPAQVRISAARTILEQAAKFTEIVDVQARLEALERYAEGGTDDEP